MAAIELGCPYFIYNPAATAYVALNAPADGSFVGYVDDITGLDSPGIRENAQVVVAGDGGYHGPFWKDRRPWTISGFVVPSFPLVTRDQAQEKLEGIIMQAMASDGTMLWTPADGIQRLLPFRAQQPPRITIGQSKVEKRFTLGLVTADWRVVGATVLSVSGTGASPLTLAAATNLGTADAAPKFTITGPIGAGTSITITNITTGKAISLVAGTVVSAGTQAVIDLSATYPTVTNAGVDASGAIDPLATDWSIAVAGTLSVTSGSNVFRLTGLGTSGATGLQVQWRHSWV